MSTEWPTHYRYTTQYFHTHVRAALHTFKVIKETSCGYWVVPEWLYANATMENKYKRWVSKDGRRRYCYPSKELAWGSYRIRCAKRVGHLRRQLADAEAAAKIEQPTDSVRVEGREPTYFDC